MIRGVKKSKGTTSAELGDAAAATSAAALQRSGGEQNTGAFQLAEVRLQDGVPHQNGQKAFRPAA